MRRRIRLTGRRQLPHSSVEVRIFPTDDPQKKLVSLSVLNKKPFQSFPLNARVRLRLFENKFFKTLEFGTLGELEYGIADLENISFSAPSCQLRVVASDEHKRGLLLGSTKTWTLRDNDENEGNTRKGILMFKPRDITPRTWKLEIREDDHPVVYIDTKIKDPSTWARNDPVFISCVLPAIIREVFEDILCIHDDVEQEWSDDWRNWADSLMPGRSRPSPGDHEQIQKWINDLLDTFCLKHHTLDRLLDHLKEEG